MRKGIKNVYLFNIIAVVTISNIAFATQMPQRPNGNGFDQQIFQLIDMQGLTAQALGMSKSDCEKALLSGKTLQDLLNTKKMSMEKFTTTLTKLYNAKIDSLLKEKKITQEQANALKQRGPMFGGRNAFGPQGQGVGRAQSIWVDIEIDTASLIVQALGLSKNDFLKAVNGGKTIGDLITSKKLTTDKFKANFKSKLSTYVDKLLKSGKITKTQAEKIKSNSFLVEQILSGRMRNITNSQIVRVDTSIDVESQIASLLGMSKSNYQKSIQSGKTLSDLLKTKNISNDKFISSLTTLLTKQIDAILKKGEITKNQATILKKNISNFLPRL